MAQLNDQEKCDKDIGNQTTLGLWYHNCRTSCKSAWHDKDPDYTHILSSMNDPTLSEDVGILRLDLLKNSDGDISKYPTSQQDIPATVEQVENYLNSLEKEWGKHAYEGTVRVDKKNEYANRCAHRWRDFLVKPKDTLDSLPPGYRLMYRPRGTRDSRAGDLYLWGHPSGLWFSSAARFSVHLDWLMKGKEGACECKPCKGKRG